MCNQCQKMAVQWVIYWMFFMLVGLCHSQLLELKDDPASQQLVKFCETHKETRLTSDAGHPEGFSTRTLSAGKHGPLLYDTIFFENIQRFYTERTPERTLCARGAGAFGYFEVTHDITKYTKAKLFDKVGKKTPVAVRFSIATVERGAPETVRDTRCFAVKFYTEEGNWDIAGKNIPVFFIRDPALIIHYAHSMKRNPRTNLRDHHAVLDFVTGFPEALHAFLFELSDRYRHMHGYGIHAFKLVNEKKEVFYAKFIFKTNQGIKNLKSEEARYLAGKDTDYATRDLYNAIEKKEYPSWSLYIQVMSVEEAEKYKLNPFDATKVWPHKEFPLIPVGKLVLDRNPLNYYEEVEQLAFNPASLPPGIEPSLDKVLQGRLFAYSGAHRYRIATNYLQLPVNSPKVKVHNYNRDGTMAYHNQEDYPNYATKRYCSPLPDPDAEYSVYNVSGTVKRWNLHDEDNFSQPRELYEKVLKPEERERLVITISEYIKTVEVSLQKKFIETLSEVSKDLAIEIVKKLESTKE